MGISASCPALIHIRYVILFLLDDRSSGKGTLEITMAKKTASKKKSKKRVKKKASKKATKKKATRKKTTKKKAAKKTASKRKAKKSPLTKAQIEEFQEAEARAIKFDWFNFRPLNTLGDKSFTGKLDEHHQNTRTITHRAP